MGAPGDDVPRHARGAQHHRVGRARHEQPFGRCLQPHRDLSELRPGGEFQHGGGRPADHADQVRAVRRRVMIKVVGDQQPRPPGLQRHRAGHIVLPKGQAVALGPDREVPGCGAAEQLREHCGRRRARCALPAHPRVRRHQGHRPPVAQHGQPFDRRRQLTVEPGVPLLPQHGQRSGHVTCAGDPVGGQRAARPHLDPQVRTGQPDEHLLGAHVIADEDGRRGAAGAPQRLQRLALVGPDHRELEHRITVGGLYPVPPAGPRSDLGEHPLRDRSLCLAHVHGHARGLDLEQHAFRAVHHPAQRSHQLAVQRTRLLIESVQEPDVELCAVAAD